MTFSCIKFKRKFKMKFNLSNYSVEAAKSEEEKEEEENGHIVKLELQDTSRSYALSKSSATSASSNSSCNLDIDTSGTGLSRTSSTPNGTANDSLIDNESKLSKSSLVKSAKKSAKDWDKNKLENVSENALDDKTNLKAQKQIRKKAETRFSSPLKSKTNTLLPPQTPPYVPSLDSMPSLPNSSTSASIAAIDSSNTTNTTSTSFISHLISSSHNVLLPAASAVLTTKSSVSNSSSSGKISDSSATNKQANLVSRLISNRMDKFRLINKRSQELIHEVNASTQQHASLPGNYQTHLHHQNSQLKVYDKINLKSKLKEVIFFYFILLIFGLSQSVRIILINLQEFFAILLRNPVFNKISLFC